MSLPRPMIGTVHIIIYEQKIRFNNKYYVLK